MNIRLADDDDAATIADLEAVAADAPWSETAIRDALGLATTVAWLAEVDGRPAAYLLTSQVDDEAEVLILGTHPYERRQGLAHALLSHAAAHWDASGVHRAFLEVREDNTPALRLYEQHGWTRTGLRRGYYRDGCDAFLLAWEPTC